MILSYNVSYIGDPFDTLIQSQSFAVSLSYPATACVNVTLTELEEFNNYTVSVQAVNSAGSGVSSVGVIAQTNAAGKIKLPIRARMYCDLFGLVTRRIMPLLYLKFVRTSLENNPINGCIMLLKDFSD